MSKFIFNPQPPTTVAINGSDKLFPVNRIFCVGRNYVAHAKEMGSADKLDPPFFFMKQADAIVVGDTEIEYPNNTSELHHEVELVVALKSQCYSVEKDVALKSVFGYAVGIDLTKRDLQTLAKNKSRPWDVAKSFYHSAPIAPLTPVNEIGHLFLKKAKIDLSLNGERKQQGKLSDMIWDVGSIISYLSSYHELNSGDLIFTGTPSGVGPIKIGDKINANITGLKSLNIKFKKRYE